jgi:hypothetical protein
MTDNVLQGWPVPYYGTKRNQETNADILWEVYDGGYDWECLALVRRAHGDSFQYAAYIDSGCSCNSPYDSHPDDYNLTWHFEKSKARDELHKAVRDSYILNDGEKTEARRSLRNA